MAALLVLLAAAAAPTARACTGYALRLPGATHLTVGQAGAVWASVPAEAGRTVEALLHLQATTDAPAVVAGGPGYALTVRNAGDGLNWVTLQAGGASVTATRAIKDRYVHVAGIIAPPDASGQRQLSLLVEGQLIAHGRFAAAVVEERDASFGPFTIGRGIKGFVDEVIVWNYGRLRSEIEPYVPVDRTAPGLSLFLPFQLSLANQGPFVRPVTSVGVVELVPNCEVAMPCTLNADVPSVCVPEARWDLADLVLLTDLLSESIDVVTRQVREDSCVLNEGCVTGTGTRTLLRFDTATANDGNIDMQLGRPAEDNEDNDVEFVYDTCHEHWHLLGYADYEVFDRAGVSVTAGRKQAFCLVDTTQYDEYSGDAEVSLRAQYFCSMSGTRDLGISAGWMDIYGKYLDCQWVDITDLPPGEYVLKITVNGERLMIESRYDNNIHHVPFVIENEDNSCGNGEVEFYQGQTEAGAAETGEFVPLADGGYITLPWTLPFFCQNVEFVYASVQGLLSIADDEAPPGHGPFPAENTISALHMEFESGDLSYLVAEDRVVVAFDNMAAVGGASTGAFQIVLHAHGDIEFVYTDVDFGNEELDGGAAATVGVRSLGANYARHSYNEAGAVAAGTRLYLSNLLVENEIPVAVPGGPYVGTAGVPLELSDGGSYDPEGGAVIEHTWLQGDGSPPLIGDPVTAYYHAAGVYSATLRVSDGFHMSEETVFTVEMGPNEPPVAVLAETEIDGAVGAAVVVDGTQSSDLEEQPLVYYWSFSDATLDRETLTPIVTVTPSTAGEDVVVTLEVGDGVHLSAPVTATIRVP